MDCEADLPEESAMVRAYVVVFRGEELNVAIGGRARASPAGGTEGDGFGVGHV